MGTWLDLKITGREELPALHCQNQNLFSSVEEEGGRFLSFHEDVWAFA